MQLTSHFTLEEFTRSEIASCYHIDNTLDPSHSEDAETIANIRALCQHVLEPLRQCYGKPIVINSGYRCKTLNGHPEVGGKCKSQHLTGEAADLRIPDATTGMRWFEWIRDNCQFDQLIKEKATKTSKSFWIHVSFSRVKNRHQVIANLIKNPY